MKPPAGTGVAVLSVTMTTSTGAVHVDGPALERALDDLGELLGALPDGQGRRYEDAAVATLLTAGSGRDVVEVVCADTSGTRRWVAPRPGSPAAFIEHVVAPAAPAAVAEAERDWVVVAFATLAMAAAELFDDTDAPNAALRAALRDPGRALAALPAGPRRIAAAAVGAGVTSPGGLSVPVLVALCPTPAADLARDTLAELLDGPTHRSVTGFLDGLDGGCGGR